MKAILILDMPTACNYCQFADFSNGQWECNQNKGVLIANAMKECSVSAWCPLKPMPSKKELANYLPFDDYSQQIRFMDYVNGYNACIEELEK